MVEEDSADQFDDAEDDLPVAIPTAPVAPPPQQPPIHMSEAVTSSPAAVKAAVSSPSPDVRRGGGVKRTSKGAPKKAPKNTPKNTPRNTPPPPPNPKRPPARQVEDYHHDPHCDADALETLAMACLQERKERPKIDKGEKVEQDQVTRTDVLCGRGGM
jgi:hypothetical protein